MTSVDMATEEGTPLSPEPAEPPRRPLYVVGERVGVLKAQEWTTGAVTSVSTANGTVRYKVDALDPPSRITTVHLIDKEEAELRRYEVDTAGWRGAGGGGGRGCGCAVDWSDPYNDWTSAAVRMRWKQTWCWFIGVSRRYSQATRLRVPLTDSAALL
jgi:hypothetical protein